MFKDPAQRARLEGILHPRIRDSFQDVLAALEATGQTLVVYEVPLLFENNLEKQMKAVILVCAPDDQRIARVMARDRLSPEDVRARMAAQMDDQTRRGRAQYVLENDGDLDHLREQVEALLVKIQPKKPGPPPPPKAPPPPKLKR